jgi:hypothetical protein
LTTVSSKTQGTPKYGDDFTVYKSYDFTSQNTFKIEYLELEHKSIQEQPSLSAKLKNFFKITFDETISRNKMLISEDIEVTEWSPDVFAYLR